MNKRNQDRISGGYTLKPGNTRKKVQIIHTHDAFSKIYCSKS